MDLSLGTWMQMDNSGKHMDGRSRHSHNEPTTMYPDAREPTVLLGHSIA